MPDMCDMTQWQIDQILEERRRTINFWFNGRDHYMTLIVYALDHIEVLVDSLYAASYALVEKHGQNWCPFMLETQDRSSRRDWTYTLFISNQHKALIDAVLEKEGENRSIDAYAYKHLYDTRIEVLKKRKDDPPVREEQQMPSLYPDRRHVRGLSFADNPQDGDQLLVTSQWFWIAVTYEAASRMFRACIQAKASGGIKQHIQFYQTFDMDTMVRDAENVKYISPRPFTVGQHCDETTETCVHALFSDFCLAHACDGLDQHELYRQAYGENDPDLFAPLNVDANWSAAQWQGVLLPQQWGQDEIDGLLKSLSSMDHRRLVAQIEQTVPYLTIPEEVRQTWEGDYR